MVGSVVFGLDCLLVVLTMCLFVSHPRKVLTMCVGASCDVLDSGVRDVEVLECLLDGAVSARLATFLAHLSNRSCGG